MTVVAGGSPAGPLAERMAELGWQMTWLGGGVFLLVLLLLLIGLFRQPDDQPEGGKVVRDWIVGGGVVLPVVIVTAVFVLTVIAMRATSLDGDGAITVEVVGHQWWWEVHYPDEGIVTANEVHLPLDRPVRLLLTSADVIHSFWVPQIGGKMDMLPEDLNTYVVQADETGVFDGACGEFCGLQHARMRFVAVASTDDDFAVWSDNERSDAIPPEGDLAVRGQEVFRAEGCGECHTVRGTEASGRKAPDLTHLAGRRTLGAGTLPHTTQNLRLWITDPHRFKEGVAMPSFPLPDDEMDALVAYLEGLE